MWIYTPALTPSATLEPLHRAAQSNAIRLQPIDADRLRRLERGQLLTAGVIALTAWTDPILALLNRRCVAQSLPLVTITPQADGLLVGPGVCGDETACLECFAQQRTLFPAAFSGQQAAGLHWPRLPQLAWTNALVVATEFTDGGQGPLGAGWIVAARHTGVYPLTRVMRQPLCPICAPLAAYPLEQWTGTV